MDPSCSDILPKFNQRCRRFQRGLGDGEGECLHPARTAAQPARQQGHVSPPLCQATQACVPLPGLQRLRRYISLTVDLCIGITCTFLFWGLGGWLGAGGFWAGRLGARGFLVFSSERTTAQARHDGCIMCSQSCSRATNILFSPHNLMQYASRWPGRAVNHWRGRSASYQGATTTLGSTGGGGGSVHTLVRRSMT